MKPYRSILGLLMVWFTYACAPQVPVTVEAQIHASFRELRKIRMMKPGEEYLAMVNGKEEAGTKEKFLRRRDGLEILQSRFSSGCGDYTKAFINKMSDYGATTLMIDAAELSQRSLKSRFAGHSVVAVFIDKESAWWLVDPTSRKILSKHWDPQAKEFEANGKRFWIGFCGAVEDYPIHSPEGLRDFYDKTLKSIPQHVLESIPRDS